MAAQARQQHHYERGHEEVYVWTDHDTHNWRICNKESLGVYQAVHILPLLPKAFTQNTHLNMTGRAK